MTFVSDRQRRAVMAMMNKLDNENMKIAEKASTPVMVRYGSDSEETLKREYDSMIHKFQSEEEKIKRDAENDKIVFSDKRGSVPLLDTTFVIRGGTPKERQAVKKLLDAIGSETALSDFNTVRIEPDLKESFMILPEARTLSLRAGDLHVKTGDFPIDLAMMVLAKSMTIRNPAIADEVALDKAKEAVTLYVADLQHKERIKREKESIEVYQIDADRQPDYDVSPMEGPQYSPVEVRLIQEAPQESMAQEAMQVGVGFKPPEPLFGGEIK